MVPSTLFLVHITEPWKFHWDSWDTVLQRCQLSFQCELAKLSFPCAVWLWDHAFGVPFMKCSLYVMLKAEWLLWTTDLPFPYYVLLTLLWKLTSRMKTFCKNLYNTVIKNIYNPRKRCVKSCAKRKKNQYIQNKSLSLKVTIQFGLLPFFKDLVERNNSPS